jgi:Lrp/AsnC family leucine-responsive transcriptional regulator
MDPLDLKLLSLLQQDSKFSFAKLGKLLGGLSISAVGERIKKLKMAGVIKGFVALLNPRAMGFDVCAFTLILTDRYESEVDFVRNLINMPEVCECHHITGEFSYIVKIRAKNTAHFEMLLKQIKKLPGVVRTNTIMTLSSPKETPALPIAAFISSAETAQEK